MKIVLLDGNEIGSKADVHALFAEKLAFPEWYGNNLDALPDMLTEPSEEIGIIAVNVEKLSKKLGKWWKSLTRVLEDAAEENENVRIVVDPFGNK